METAIIIAIAVAFAGMLFVNIYFRVRVLKAYKKLVKARVEFDATDMLNERRIDEIVRRYPQHEQIIRDFTGGIRSSMSIATALIVLITALGATLMWYR